MNSEAFQVWIFPPKFSNVVVFALDKSPAELVPISVFLYTVLGTVWIKGALKKNKNFWKLFLEYDLHFTEAFTVELYLIKTIKNYLI